MNMELIDRHPDTTVQLAWLALLTLGVVGAAVVRRWRPAVVLVLLSQAIAAWPLIVFHGEFFTRSRHHPASFSPSDLLVELGVSAGVVMLAVALPLISYVRQDTRAAV
jgi:zinc transporter ZupT